MNVREAKAIARQWVQEEGATLPGFEGALTHGSMNYLPDEALLPPTSDVDVLVVTNAPSLPEKRGKFLYRDALLEVSFLTIEWSQEPERTLSRYHLAGSFRTPNLLADPSGRLTQLQQTVEREFAQRRWVSRRCEDARANCLRHLQGLNAAETLHEGVACWLFAAGVTTHVLLTAGLRNPTVRCRYLDARELLAEYRRLDFYERLLELLGCAAMTPAQANRHLDALAEAFDTTKALVQPSFPFASDLTDLARPIAIDGSRALIERGDHREAVFWIVATYSRCLSALPQDAPPEWYDRLLPGYQRLLADLGVGSLTEAQRRGEEVRSFLPHVWAVAEALIAENPNIES